MTKVYNDTVFGGISWSKDSKHIVFIGEKPEVSKYKPFYKDEEEKKEEKKDEEKKEDDKEKEKEFWQDEKFLLKEHFGETLAAKQNPAVFVFDLESNKLNQLQFGKHLPVTDYPQYPVFDEHSKGIVFSAVSMPIKKLGLNFCLNRPTSLYYVKDPVYKKDEVDKVEEGKYLTCVNPGEYVGMQARFSDDYTRLCYFASTNQFLSHSGNYEMKYLKWPLADEKPVTVIPEIKEYPDD